MLTNFGSVLCLLVLYFLTHSVIEIREVHKKWTGLRWTKLVNQKEMIRDQFPARNLITFHTFSSLLGPAAENFLCILIPFLSNYIVTLKQSFIHDMWENFINSFG